MKIIGMGVFLWSFAQEPHAEAGFNLERLLDSMVVLHHMAKQKLANERQSIRRSNTKPWTPFWPADGGQSKEGKGLGTSR